MNIADYIPYGRENDVSRAELHRLTGIPDRDIRDAIKRANIPLAAEGKAILSSAGARGYWITEDLAEMEAYLAESARRSKSQYQNDAPVRNLVRRLGGTGTVHVTDYYRRVRKSDPEISGQITFGEG